MSDSIILGATDDGTAVRVDIPTLVDSRALITGNSGAGKSRLLRRLAEQAFGKVQIIVIDPEGEFATLRERHGFLLAGRTGEVLAEPRAAALLAKRLMELRTSAVIDLYDLRLDQRRAFVKLFLGELIDLPKDLYAPCLVLLDEAHLFAPEGKDQAESRNSVIDLMTRGRKRGICGILATQRISKLDKDAAAEAKNVFIGGITLDTDQGRAADTLGLPSKADRLALRDVPPHQFFAFGPALSQRGVCTFTTGETLTTHPRAGQRHKLEATPTPDAVRKIAAELQDLPQQAEEEIRTLEQAQAAVRELKRELRAAKAAQPPAPKPGPAPKRVEVSVLKPADVARLERLAGKVEKATAGLTNERDRLAQAQQAMLAESANLRRALDAAKSPSGGGAVIPRTAPPLPPIVTRVEHALAKRAEAQGNGHGGALTGPERKLLTALAQHGTRSTSALALLTGYAASGGAFRNPLSALRAKGYADGRASVSITDAGREALGDWTPLPEGAGLLAYWLEHLAGPERKLLVEVARAWPKSLSVEDLAAGTGYEATGGAFRNPLSRLRTLELVSGRGEVVAARELFA